MVLLAIMVTTGFYEIARISEKRNNKLYKLMVRFGQLTREIDAKYFVKFKRLLDMGCDNITPENTVTPDNTTPKN